MHSGGRGLAYGGGPGGGGGSGKQGELWVM